MGNLNINPSQSINVLTLILKIIYQYGVKHINTLLIKTTPVILKVVTYVIISNTARPLRLSVVLVIMSISTLKTAIILYFFIDTINNFTEL